MTYLVTCSRELFGVFLVDLDILEATIAGHCVQQNYSNFKVISTLMLNAVFSGLPASML